MIDGRFGAYVVVATLLIITPGPDTALTIRNALRFGQRTASMSTFGIALGSLAWGIAAVLGVAVLLERSATAFTIFKLAGAAFLVFLGLRSIVTSFRSPGRSSTNGELRRGSRSRHQPPTRQRLCLPARGRKQSPQSESGGDLCDGISAVHHANRFARPPHSDDAGL